ncbi:MAG TPA: hypothetical protein VN609_01050 [Propionibacteriaceae bacterium]|nr:hypothetical protein [Propionibacteriaceae bacterium]
MSASASVIDRRIFLAYQRVKKARADGNYQTILKWMARLDVLLDERTRSATPQVS